MANTDDGKVKQTIYISETTSRRLERYILQEYGRNVRALSITVEKALNEFLDRHPETDHVPA